MIVLKELTFSLMMFNGKTQRASCFWREPDGPNFWNVHFATYTKLVKKQKATRLHFQTFGKTRFSGSSLTLIGSSICDNTSLKKRQNVHMFDIWATTSSYILKKLLKYEDSFSKQNLTCQIPGTGIQGTCQWRRSGRPRWQSWEARKRRTWGNRFLSWFASGWNTCRRFIIFNLFVLKQFTIYEEPLVRFQKFLLCNQFNTVSPRALVHEGANVSQT